MHRSLFVIGISVFLSLASDKASASPSAPTETTSPSTSIAEDHDRTREDVECLEDRIKDYLYRHGDLGVIDPEILLYRTREFHDAFQRDRRLRALSGIAGTSWTNIGPTT